MFVLTICEVRTRLIDGVAGVIRGTIVVFNAVKMAVQSDGSGRDEIKTQFITREGTYKQMALSEYSRPNRLGYNTQGNTPVKVSFVSLPDQPGNDVRICFNVGRELYTYIYKGVKKVNYSLFHNLSS